MAKLLGIALVVSMLVNVGLGIAVFRPNLGAPIYSHVACSMYLPAPFVSAVIKEVTEVQNGVNKYRLCKVLETQTTFFERTKHKDLAETYLKSFMAENKVMFDADLGQPINRANYSQKMRLYIFANNSVLVETIFDGEEAPNKPIGGLTTVKIYEQL